LIKINLIREGRAAVRGAAAAGGAPAAAGAGGAANLNNFLVLGLLLFGVLAAGGYWFIKNKELTDKQAQVETQRAEAAKLEKIIKEVEEFEARKKLLEKRIETINNLKKAQRGPVRVMDRISQDLPDLVWLDRMSLSGQTITLDGRGLNPNAIANFVVNIKSDPLFEEPDVSGVQQVAGSGPGPMVYRFGMTFKFKYALPGEEAEAGTDEKAAEGKAAAATPGT
jgi:type IV pilus assembly protein PilN